MKLLLAMMFMFLVGCSALPPIHNPQQIEESQLATIYTSKLSGRVWDGVDTGILLIWNTEGKEITNRNEIIHLAFNEYKLPAGNYKIKGFCHNSQGHASPEATFTLEAGQEYDLHCETIRGKTLLGVSINVGARLIMRDPYLLPH